MPNWSTTTSTSHDGAPGRVLRARRTSWPTASSTAEATSFTASSSRSTSFSGVCSSKQTIRSAMRSVLVFVLLDAVTLCILIEVVLTAPCSAAPFCACGQPLDLFVLALCFAAIGMHALGTVNTEELEPSLTLRRRGPLRRAVCAPSAAAEEAAAAALAEAARRAHGPRGDHRVAGGGGERTPLSMVEAPAAAASADGGGAAAAAADIAARGVAADRPWGRRGRRRAADAREAPRSRRRALARSGHQMCVSDGPQPVIQLPNVRAAGVTCRGASKSASRVRRRGRRP